MSKPQPIFRPVTEADTPGFLKVISLTYNGGKPFDPEKPIFRHAQRFAGELDGEIVSGFGVLEMSCTRSGADIPCVGVLGVAVAPHARQSGIGNKMMEWGLQHYRNEGFALAGLYAFRESFYRKQGYEGCGQRLQIKVESARLPRLSQSLPVKVLGTDSSETIRSCYEAFALARSGLSLRPHGQWDRILNPDSHRAVYVAGEPVEAYAIVQHQSDFWAEQRVEEFVWTTRRGYDSILETLRGIAINKTQLIWTEPSDGLHRTLYVDYGAQIESLRPNMFRVIHVPKALEALRPTGSGAFTFEVDDNVLPENNGPWSVTFEPGNVQVKQATEAGFKIDIRQFAQALLGEPSLADLVRNGLVDVKDPAAVANAMVLLPPSPTICLDPF